MDQYARQNAIHTIDGYFLPKPSEKQEAAFERARLEALKNLRQSLANIEAISFDQFAEERGLKRNGVALPRLAAKSKDPSSHSGELQ